MESNPSLLVPDWPDLPPGVAALSTTRAGGVSAAPYDDGAGRGGWNFGTHVADEPRAVAENRRRLRQLLPCEPAWLNQVHGTTVVDAATAIDTPAADASIATSQGAVCVVMTADCLPVLFSDRQGKVVGAAHAGWRGLAHGVLEKTVTSMRAAGAGELTAWLGPAIGPSCFEVGAEVRAAFVQRAIQAEAAFVVGESGKYLADIYLLARQALAQVGVTRVFGGKWCTVSEPSRFYSFRRDGVTGRMASLIWIR